FISTSSDDIYALSLHDALPICNALASLNAQGGTRFTYVLVDCPPSLNLLTVNAMAAANAIVVPLQCEFFALEGLSQLLKTVESRSEEHTSELQSRGHLVCRLLP